MDSAALEQIVPMVAILGVFGAPVAYMWVKRHFALKEKEYELEAQLQGKELEARLRTIETGLAHLAARIDGPASSAAPSTSTANRFTELAAERATGPATSEGASEPEFAPRTARPVR